MQNHTLRPGLSLLLGIVVGVALPLTSAPTSAQSAAEWQFDKVLKWEQVPIPAAPDLGALEVTGSPDVRGGSIEAIITRATRGNICPQGGKETISISWSFAKPVDKLRPGELVEIDLKLDPKTTQYCPGEGARRSALMIRPSANGIGSMPANLRSEFWEQFTAYPEPGVPGSRVSYTPSFDDQKSGKAFVRVNASTQPDGARGYFGFTFSAGGATGRNEEIAFAYTYKYVRNPGPTTTATPTATPTPTTSPTSPNCGDKLPSSIKSKWLEKGGESYYGCPESDPRPGSTSAGGTTSTVVDFPKRERAMFVEHTSGPLTGRVFVVDECFSKLYRQLGGTSSWLGLPKSDGTPTSFGARQEFENGYMVWYSSNFRCEARKNGGDVADPGPGTSTSTRMTLEARDYTVQPGGTVQVPIYLRNGENVANMNFTVAYDIAVARIDGSAAKGNLLGDALFSSNPGEERLFRGAFAGRTGVSGDGTVAYISFRAVGPAGSKTPLTLAVTTINQPGGNSPPIRLIHGSITIGATMAGDCDNDRIYSANDALCALKMSVKLMPVVMTMDVDGNGEVTSRDAAIILQRIPR